ncbi:MAG: tetratricopeptide repeat protein [Planctomycetota bacterium]|nr:tetratricopeptide repeat protein [Planctomycetota bacterium]
MRLPFVTIWAEGLGRLRDRAQATGAARYALIAVAAALVAHLGIGAAGPVWGYEAINYDDPQVLAAIEEKNAFELLTEPTYFAYKPLYFLSLKIDSWIGAVVGDTVAVAHIVNWLLHAACAGLLVLLLAHALGNAFVAFGAGLLFAVHPAHVESVAWISERKDLLSLLFVLWAHVSYRLRREEGRGRFVVPAIWLLLGGLTKGTVWSYAGVIAADELVHQARHGGIRMRALLPRLAPLLVVALGGVVLDGWVGVTFGPGAVEHDATTGQLVAAMADVHTQYVQHVLVPVNLALDYAVSPAGSWSNPAAWVGVLLVVGWVMLLVVSVRRRSWLGAFAAAFWIFGLAPVNNIWPRTTTLMADKYLYVPAIGLYLLLAYAISKLGSARTGVLTVVAVLLGFLCIARTGDFRNSEAAWSANIEAVPDSAIAHIQRGQDRARRAVYKDALTDAERAVSLRPRAELLVRARLVRCAALLGLGQAKKLRYEAQAVVELIESMPDTALLREERGGILAEGETFLGNAFQAIGYEIAALEAFERAVNHDPESGVALYNFATALAGLGDAESLAEAEALLTRAMPLLRGDRTMHKQAMIQMAAVYGRRGRADKALTLLLDAGKRYPNDAEVFYAEARLRLAAGEINQAKELLNTIRHFHPENAKAARLSAEILVAEGQLFLRKFKDDRDRELLKRALHKFDQAIEADAAYWEAHVAAGDAFMERGLFREARDRYVRALRTNEQLGWVRSLIARTHVIEAAWMDKFAARDVPEEAVAAVRERAAGIVGGGLKVDARRIDFGFTVLEEEQALLREVGAIYESAEGPTKAFASAVLRAAAHLCAGGDADRAGTLVADAAGGLTDDPGHDTIRQGVLLLRAMMAEDRTDIEGAQRDYTTLAAKRAEDALPQRRLLELELLIARARYKTALGYKEDRQGLAAAATQQEKALSAVIAFADDHPDSVAAGLLAVEAEMARGQWTDALRRLNRLVERAPDNPSVYRGRATVYLRQRTTTQEQLMIRELTLTAGRELQKAIALDPRDLRAHLDASNLARSAQDLGMALKHARRARQLEPYPGGPASQALSGLLTALARKAIDARELKRARELIDEARKVDARGAMPWVLEAELALATPSRDRLVKSRELATKAKELEPLSPQVNKVLAKIVAESGRVAFTRAATVRMPKSPMLGKDGKIDKEAWAKKTPEEQQRLIKAYDGARAKALAQKDRLRQTAIRDFELALALLPPGAEEIEQIEERLASLRQSDPLRRQRDQRRAMLELYPAALAARRAERPAEAFETLLQAVALYPRYEQAHLRIAETVAMHLLGPRYRWDKPEDRKQIDEFLEAAFLSLHMLDQLDGAGLYIERFLFRGVLNHYLYKKTEAPESRAAAIDALTRYGDSADAWIAAEVEKPDQAQNPAVLGARRQFVRQARLALRQLK